MKLKAALLLDNLSLTRWQREALEEASSKIDIVLVLNCKNTSTKKQPLRHFFYYLINILSLKNTLTQREKFQASTAEIVSFDSTYKGMWQSIPASAYDALHVNGVDLVIKFGMNLLHIEEGPKTPPFLSFHHGDPSKYRGRPAGFYEIQNGEKTTGTIVQQLSNELDAGKIYAYGESKVVNFSYKKTAMNFYGNSKYLLPKAIDNLSHGRELNVAKDGINYRLPSNFIALRFLVLLASNALRKLCYGLFFEKKWKVALAPNHLLFLGNEAIPSQGMTEIPIGSGYNFYADPFFSTDGECIRLEALDNRSGLGDIVEVSLDDISRQKTTLTGAHYSYPYSFEYEGKEYLLPEVASHSAQYILAANEIDGEKVFVQGLEDKRIVDATLIAHEGHWFLFFGEKSTAHTLLNVWHSASPFGEFNPHPQTPVVISPKAARMGGGVQKVSGRLLRFGQNNSGEYGESLAVMEIKNLSPLDYVEEPVGKILMEDFKGPHSLNVAPHSKRILIDYYSDRFSLFAGVRRIKAKLSKK